MCQNPLNHGRWVRYHTQNWALLVETGWTTHIVDNRRMFQEDPLEDWAYMILVRR